MKCFLKLSIFLTLFSISTTLQPAETTRSSRPENPYQQQAQRSDTHNVGTYTHPVSTHSIAHSAETVINIIDVVRRAQASDQQQLYSNLQDLINDMMRPSNHGNPINQDINNAQLAIVKAANAARSLLSIIVHGGTITTANVFDTLRQAGYQVPGERESIIRTKQPYDLFAQNVFIACYQPIVQRDLLGGGILSMSSSPELQIKQLTTSNTTTQELFKHQVIEILERISLLWHITFMFFNHDSIIALQYPQATMSIRDWFELTNNASTKLQGTTELGKELQAKRSQIATQMQDLEKKERKQAAEIAKLEKVTREFAALALARNKIEEEHLQGLRDLGRQAYKEKRLASLPQDLRTAQTLIDSFETCRKYHRYTHLLFTKNKISEQIETTLDTLKDILVVLTQPTPTTAATTTAASTATTAASTSTATTPVVKALPQLKKLFIQQMNDLYSCLFKKEFAPGSLISRTPEFLCFKHTFNTADGEAKPADLTEREAVPAVASLVMLWEIYKNLSTDAGSESIQLPYFNKTETVNEWLNNTKNCGFKEYGTFSYPLAPGRPSHLDTALSLCSPEKEPTFFDRSLESVADTFKSIEGWFSSTWTRLTAKSRSIVDEPDKI